PRLFPAPLQGLWARGRALCPARLQGRGAAHRPGRPLDLPLSFVPEVGAPRRRKGEVARRGSCLAEGWIAVPLRRLMGAAAALALALTAGTAWALPPVW